MNTRESYDIVIIGGGAAGVAALQGAVERRAAVSGGPLSLAIISEEDRLPYKRTKISKSVARGFSRDEFAIQDPEWYLAHSVRLITGRKAVSLDPERHIVLLDDGRKLAWRKLILTTGAGPRLPGDVDPGDKRVFRTHDAEDIERLREWATVHPGHRGIILGGGVLGVEVAWELHQLGHPVTVVGSAPRLLPRELDAVAADELRRLCESSGVEVFLGERDYPIGDVKGGFSLRLQGAGRETEGNFVVLAAGLAPRLELADAAGIATGRAIRVDEELKSSAEDVYAAGDCCEHSGGRVTHLWRDALRQGAVAGANAAAELLETDPELTPYRYQPFRLKCEVFGRYFFSICRPADEEEAGFESVVYRDAERYVRAYFNGRNNPSADNGSVAETLRGVVMVGDKENQQRYMSAVLEGWGRRRFEEEFLLNQLPGGSISGL